MESDDEFDMLPVKRRGPPVTKPPNGLDSDLHNNSNFVKVPDAIPGVNGIDDDIALLPVKRRGAPVVVGIGDDPFDNASKAELPEYTDKDMVGVDVSLTNESKSNGFYNHLDDNPSNELDILNDEDLDIFPVKHRNTPVSMVKSEPFVKHRGILDSLGDDPFDNISIKVSNSPQLPGFDKEEVAQPEGNTKPTNSNGLSDVLQNEMFDHMGLKESHNNATTNIYNLSSIDSVPDDLTDNDDVNDDFLVCQEPAQRKPKGVSFDIGDLPNIDPAIPPGNNNVDLDKQDIGNDFDDMFQAVETTDFIDGLDYLEQCGGNDTDAMEQLQRKSLYVRFDPLYDTKGDTESSKPVAPATNNKPIASNIIPIDDESLLGNNLTTSHDHFLPEAKQHTAADNPFSPVKFSGSSVGDNDLKELYPAAKPDLNTTGLVEPLLYTQSDMDEIIKKAKIDLDDDVHAREMDWKKKYEELENKIKEEVAMRELIEQDYRGKIDCLKKDSSDMKQVLSQYERTIVELTENSHYDNKSKEETLAETIRVKEQLQEDINTAEQNLFDAYKRIEKLKQTIDTYKHNEKSLKENNGDVHSKLKQSEDRYNKLKEHATEKIDGANTLIHKVRKQHEVDTAGLQASLKVAQNKVHNLELEIQQKNLENQQLSQICDDLIKKVSGE